jgi:ketosteroid isomerase-like protein
VDRQDDLEHARNPDRVLDTAPIPDNVEIAKRANEAFNAGDVDGFIAVIAPDAEMTDLANAPDQRRAIKGTDAIREVWTLWAEAFDELRADVEEYTAVGDFVICRSHWVGQGKGSGISIDLRQFDVFEYHEGKCVSAMLGVESKAEALKMVARKAEG